MAGRRLWFLDEWQTGAPDHLVSGVNWLALSGLQYHFHPLRGSKAVWRNLVSTMYYILSKYEINARFEDHDIRNPKRQ